MKQQAPFQFTSRNVLSFVAFISMIGSGFYWWGLMHALTENIVVAAAYTSLLVFAPPALLSFVIPWSPGGMLLQKINGQTWGYSTVVACAGFLIYYSYMIQYSWWAAQQVVADTGLVQMQSWIGVIGFIVIPALLWTPVSTGEMVETIKQAQLVKRYELQTQADIAILRNTLLRAQEMALVGFANLTVQEREELAAVMHGLVSGIDATLKEIQDSVYAVSGATVPFKALMDNDDIAGYLDYVANNLVPRENETETAPIMEQAQRRMAPALAKAGKR
jgi:hypothetical protein